MVAKKKAAQAAELPLEGREPPAGEGIGSEFQRFTEAEAAKEDVSLNTERQAADEAEWAGAAPVGGEEVAQVKPKGGWGKKVADKPAPSAKEDDVVDMSNAKKSLVSFVERVERLVEERSTINEDIKEVFAEIRAVGYNTKIVREVMKRRKWAPDVLKEHDSLLDLYEEALR